MSETFFEKLKKRRVWKTIVAYPAASFVILQAVDFFIIKYGLNPRALTFTLVLLCGGFFIALIWNWYHGEIGHQNYTKTEGLTYGIIAFFTFSLAVYATNTVTVSETIADNGIKERENYRLAVLPFTGVSGDDTLEYLSQGIPENLINRLSQNTSFQLVSKRSSFLIPEKERVSEVILSNLNANLMLTGTIQRIADNLVVNCQLIDTETNSQVWGEKVAHKEDGLIAIENDIVNSLLKSLPQKFKKNLGVSKTWSDNQEAQAHYMKGRALSYGSTNEEIEKALNHFREAIKLDPEFVAAYVAIANEKQTQAMFATDTRAETFHEARLAVQTALNLDPNYAEAYTVDAMIKLYQDRDWEAAEAAYKKALQLDPNNANTLVRYTFFLTIFKRYDEAVAMANKAVAVDPISISSLHILGWANLVSKNYTEAEQAFSEALEIHPNWIWGYIKRGYAHVFQGKCEAALQDTKNARQLIGERGSELLEACFIFIYDQCGYDNLKIEATQNYLRTITPENYDDPMAMAFVYTSKGDYEKALQWLQIAVEEENTGFYQFTLDYAYPQVILDDPRFIQMKTDLKLPL
jgi:TolB-like protein/Tfp pilus assembly protein PilF